MTTLTVKEAAERLKLSPASVYAMCKARVLRHTRVGESRGKILISEEAIEEYLAGGTVATSATVPSAARVTKPKLRHLHLPS